MYTLNIFFSLPKQQQGESKKEKCRKNLKINFVRFFFKASYAEKTISVIKSHLYKLLRSLGEDDWVKYLPDVVFSLNATPHLELGYQQPSSVRSSEDEPRIREARALVKSKMSPKTKERYFGGEPEDYKQELRNMENYVDTGLKVGDFVYANLKRGAMDKGYDYQRGRLYIVHSVLTRKRPVRFLLRGLR
jgi:hypothetical protein